VKPVADPAKVLAELKRSQNNVTLAAKTLGLERSHLYKKAEQLGIDLRVLRREQGQNEKRPHCQRSRADSCQAFCTGESRYSITVRSPSLISEMTCMPGASA